MVGNQDHAQLLKCEPPMTISQALEEASRYRAALDTLVEIVEQMDGDRASKEEAATADAPAAESEPSEKQP